MEPKTDAQLVAMSVFDIFVRQLDEPTRIAVMYDCEDRYIAINSACLGVLQLSEADVLGRKNGEIISDTAQVAHIESMLAETRSTRDRVVDRHRVIDTEYETVYSPVTVRGAVVAVLGLCSPIQPEIDLVRERNTALESQAALQRSLIGMLESNRHVLTVVVDPSGVIEYISPSCETILGRTEDTLRGTRHRDLVHPDDVRTVEALLAAPPDALSSGDQHSSSGSLSSTVSGIAQQLKGQAATSAAAAAAAGGAGDGANAPPRASEVVGQNGRRATYRRRRADGSYVGLALRDGLRYLGAAGRLYFQEVAVSRLLEEESIEHKQMYITRTAHDLKTPVTTFRLALDQLAATPITDEQRELLEQATLATEFMQIIVRQAIDVGRLSRGAQVTPNRGVVNLDTLLTKCEWLLAGYPKSVPVVTRRDAGCAREVITDGEWLWEILMNFLTNACKYTHAGSVVLGLSARCPGDGAPPRLRVECTDTGIGVSAEKQHALFTPFAKLQTRCLSGTGIGLYNVQQKCLALKGECGMYLRGGGGGGDDDDGPGGSTFWAEVPYTPVTPPASELPPSRARAGSAANDEPAEARFPNHTALIVDDTSTILKLLTRMLERKQFSVVCAADGAEALERLKAQHFNIALLDVQMPRMDGIECVRRLRQWEKSRGEKGGRRRQLTVALSANSEVEDRAACLEAGMDDFLAKPVTAVELEEMLVRHLFSTSPPVDVNVRRISGGGAAAAAEAAGGGHLESAAARSKTLRTTAREEGEAAPASGPPPAKRARG